MMIDLIKNSDFRIAADCVRPDTKKRIVLPKTVMRDGVVFYHIYSNKLGQIILDPQVTIPASEAWLFNNPDALASVRRGLSDAAQDNVSKIEQEDL